MKNKTCLAIGCRSKKFVFSNKRWGCFGVLGNTFNNIETILTAKMQAVWVLWVMLGNKKYFFIFYLKAK